jgi:glutamate-1-semialdehyde 2,1-aminomutase
MKKTWDDRARAVFAQGCNTYSKRSDQFVKGVFPTHIDDLYTDKRNTINSLFHDYKSCQLYTNGKWYTDMIGGLGSTILYPENNYCLPTQSEVILAEMIKKRIPFIDKMRFLKTGSESTQAAVRIARAYKENNSEKSFNAAIWGHGYHGWHNIFISQEYPGTGSVKEGYVKAACFDWLIEGLKSKKIQNYLPCGIIIEPVQLDYSECHVKKLKELRRLCSQKNICLIFDEVITGFRTPKYCMSQYLGIEPDIICLGKAIANGYPLAVVGGKAKYMDTPDYFISSTFAGELSAIHKGIETINALTPKVLNDLWNKGKWFQDKFNQITPKLQLIGIPTKMVYEGEEMFKHLFWQEMCLKQWLTGKALHIFVYHTKKILSKFIADSKECIQQIETGKVKLKGELSRNIFKRY